MYRTITSTFAFFLLVFGVFAEDEDWERTISLEDELGIATERLVNSPGHVVVAVDGMCCRTCSIGISKKVYRLDFVNVKALNKGTEVDRHNGLLTVALKPGQELQTNPLIVAIKKAGYEPVRLYQRDGAGKVSVEAIPQ